MSEKAAYIIKAPIQFGSYNENDYFMLPTGTTLYYDDSFPEGFDRFHVYIDLKDDKLLLENIERPDLIAPVSADIIRSDEYLLPVLENYPLTKEDLLSILKNDPPGEKDAKSIIQHLKTYINDLNKKDDNGAK